jgi:hypothetical protein
MRDSPAMFRVLNEVEQGYGRWSMLQFLLSPKKAVDAGIRLEASEAMRFAETIPLRWSAETIPLRWLVARVVMGLFMLCYVLVLIASHSVPLSSALETPCAYAGYYSVTFMFVLGLFPARAIAIPAGVWRWIPHLAFVAAAVLAYHYAVTGNIPHSCAARTFGCPDLHWRMSGGHYYRQIPYDRQGNADPGAPWVEISRQAYIAEFGSRLRQAAQDGLNGLCFAWLALAAIRSRWLARLDQTIKLRSGWTVDPLPSSMRTSGRNILRGPQRKSSPGTTGSKPPPDEHAQNH